MKNYLLKFIGSSLIAAGTFSTFSFVSELQQKEFSTRKENSLEINLAMSKINENSNGVWNVNWDLFSESEMSEYQDKNIKSLTFKDERLNLQYRISQKMSGFMDIPDYTHKTFWTEDGPGDAENNNGYPETDPQDKYKVTLDEDNSVYAGEEETIIAQTYVVTNYDEYQDDNFIGTNGPRDGYYYDTLTIKSSLTSRGIFSLYFDEINHVDYHDVFNINDFTINVNFEDDQSGESFARVSQINSTSVVVEWNLNNPLEIDPIITLEDNHGVIYNAGNTLSGEIIIANLTPNTTYDDWKLVASYEEGEFEIIIHIDPFTTLAE